ncbi:hypothetical protein llap_16964 [Limosa lapponica baueri]|uniref:Uncharacterized protein n=1 Tax=Limosa lapponica baueri TaxID=1758121 RepID=A0A2I0TFY8_LIMLA|nr:hypothetical protein llap_16964 [Limosa lapponica baueri]
MAWAQATVHLQLSRLTSAYWSRRVAWRMRITSAARQRPHQLRPENLLHRGARERPLLHLGPDGLQRPQPRRPPAAGLLQAAQGPAQGLRHLGRPGRRHAPAVATEVRRRC